METFWMVLAIVFGVIALSAITLIILLLRFGVNVFTEISRAFWDR